MASIRAIEGRTVHQIQSGQVIVDLNSVVKELVENGLDAGATSIDVRFKNHGLELVEVQDNGSGIAPDNFEAVALKHYTSKLKDYGDLDGLQTFGFRGEALSSLAALSTLSVTTAREQDAPKGNRLEFETSGKLKEAKLVPTQKGTVVSVENIFQNLPVRRRELERNIKREYNKVLGLLYAYACISVNVKFTVTSTLKGKKTIAFSTKLNGTVRENIANVFGAKTLSALVPLHLELEMDMSDDARIRSTRAQQSSSNQVVIKGHISRPVFGEGRLLPDRQMFFVNGRPCALPQVAKAFNEVYKSFNLSQSPFIFADLQLDTGSYDVNVSPDKRTILLHDQNALLESIKTSLTNMFDEQEQTVPQNVLGRTPSMKQTKLNGPAAARAPSAEEEDDEEVIGNDTTRTASRRAFLETINRLKGKDVQPATEIVESASGMAKFATTSESQQSSAPTDAPSPSSMNDIPSFTQQRVPRDDDIVKSAFDRARPRRSSPEMATVTIGNQTTVSPLKTPRKRHRQVEDVDDTPGVSFGKLTNLRITRPRPSANRAIRDFAAPGSQLQLSSASARGRPGPHPGSKNESSAESEPEPESESDQEAMITRDEKSISDSNSNEGVLELEDDIKSSKPIVFIKNLRTSARKSNVTIDSDQIYASSDENQKDISIENTSDGEYVDDDDKKKAEERKVAQLIADAEEDFEQPDLDLVSHARKIMHGPRQDYVSEVSQLSQTVSLGIDSLQEAFESHSRLLATTRNDAPEDDALDGLDDDISRLELTISKPDFPLMRVIGQFNLGFILTTRMSSDTGPNVPRENLFIIDQHASAEKTTFERLSTSFVIESQPLVAPLQLNLTAVEEEILLASLPALRTNGFSVAIDNEAPVGKRCSLLTLPISKSHTFTLRDLEELLGLLQDSPAGFVPRPTKVRAILASRACRSSVMIGKALTNKQMKGIVSGLGGLEKPWNCPHGRPTMRHLCALDHSAGWSGAEEGY